jgi:superfamily II DNA or RNA helicase
MLHRCHLPGIQKLINALKTRGSALDSSETGTGKTFRALAAVKELGCSAFVVCLKNGKPSWIEAALDLDVPLVGVINYEGVRSNDSPWWFGGKKGIFVGIPAGTIFIFDESHRLNGSGTWFARYGIAAKAQGYKILLLSATPASSPMHLRTQGYILGLFELRDHWGWLTRWGMQHMYYGGVGMSPAAEARAMKRIGAQLESRGQLYSVTLRSLVEQGFPENNICARQIEVRNAVEIRKNYSQLSEALTEVEAKKLSANDILTLQLRFRQEIELLKVPDIAEEVTNILESSRASVIIFVNFRDTVAALVTCLDKGKDDLAVLMGGQSEAERKLNLDNFNSHNNRIRILIATVASGGTSVNLHDTSGDKPRHVLMCPTYSAPDFKQALGRAHRMGSKSPTQQEILFATNTVEEHVYKAVRQKLSNLKSLTNNDLAGL